MTAREIMDCINRRTQLGISTKKELAEKMQVSPNNMNNWTNFRTKITVEDMVRMLDIFGLDLVVVKRKKGIR